MTGTAFTIVALDSARNAGDGKIIFNRVGSGSRELPLSAGGELNVFASTIVQNGVLRAPLGTINLGFNPSLVTNFLRSTTALGATTTVSLGDVSITSVSAVDPITGQGLILP